MCHLTTMMQLMLLHGYILSKFQACLKYFCFTAQIKQITDTPVMQLLSSHLSPLYVHTYIYIHTNKA